MKNKVSYSDLTESEVTAMEYFITDAELTLVKFEEYDISDFSLETDISYVYQFATEEDALHFVLRFGGELR